MNFTIENLNNSSASSENDNFMMRDVLSAPLLDSKEEIEDVCISAVKEKDIESKLNTVINEWDAHLLTFSTFKTRGFLIAVFLFFLKLH